MKDPILVAFGQRIRTFRKQKGISQENLAALAGLDRSYLGHVERGEKNITLLKIYQIANALDRPPGQLLSENATRLPTG